jgi:hypothetical protein
MGVILDGYRDGTYTAQCDKCGVLNYASEMEEPPAQSPGGGPSGLLVCKRHRVVYQPLNDLAEVLAQYDDPTPAPVPRPDKTVDVSTPVAEPAITAAVGIPIITTPAATFVLAPVLALVGTGFSSFFPRSLVQWDGQPIPTVFGSATSITGTVPAELCTVGTHLVTVWNVGPPDKLGTDIPTSATGDTTPGSEGTNLTAKNLSNTVTVVLT